jgi:hypothetical protein
LYLCERREANETLDDDGHDMTTDMTSSTRRGGGP